jgi:hypothetical protein
MQMHSRAKIRLDSIEQAHRALDALPEHKPEELTKTQAVRQLLEPIRATQSKGYSLAAIGKVLAGCGIPITTGALRAYLSDANAGAVARKKPKAKRAATAPKTTRSGAARSDGNVAATQPIKPGPVPSVATPEPPTDLDWEPVKGSAQAAVVSKAPPGARFYVRPDSEDL